jgi:hypothetical protein
MTLEKNGKLTFSNTTYAINIVIIRCGENGVVSYTGIPPFMPEYSSLDEALRIHDERLDKIKPLCS